MVAQLAMNVLGKGAAAATGRGLMLGWRALPGWAKWAGAVTASEMLKGSVLHPVGIGVSPAPAPAPAGGMGMTPQQFDRLYGNSGIGVGPWTIPGTGQSGYLEQQAAENRALQRQMIEGNITATRIGAGTQRYGYDIQERIARQNSQTQAAIAGMTTQAQRDLGYAANRAQYGMTDLTSRRQLAGVFDSNRAGIGIANRQLAGIMDQGRTQVEMANRQLRGLYDTNRANIYGMGIQSNAVKYQTDRALEGERIRSIGPRLAQIGSIFASRY